MSAKFASVSLTDVENICKFYSLNADLIARERNSFVHVYKSMASVIDVSDLSLATSRQRKLRNNDNNQAAPQRNLDVAHDNSDGEDYSDDNDDTQSGTGMKWLEFSFVKPLRALEELSSFPNLLCLMKILVTVAVTSCSAERVMSRVKIMQKTDCEARWMMIGFQRSLY